VFMRFFGQDRESGTIIPKQARYQTAPRPEIFWVVLIFSCENRCFCEKTINCGLHVVVCAFSLFGLPFGVPESPMNTGFLRKGIFYSESVVPFPKKRCGFIVGSYRTDKKSAFKSATVLLY